MGEALKIRVGITGQQGFVGWHLYHRLALLPGEFDLVDFERDWFEDNARLDAFVSRCDVVVHLAAMNRHESPQVIYDTNVGLARRLVAALERTRSKAHVLVSSSTQEERDNLYGKSKKEGRELLAGWAAASGGKCTGLVIPNVFGPFGRPFYNSFIATFCHQLTHGEVPAIQTDGEVALIYVGELVERMVAVIRTGEGLALMPVAATAVCKVSDVLARLQRFKADYLEKGIVPVLADAFEHNLFNTFRSFIDHRSHFPVKLVQHADNRGAFVEVVRMGIGGQSSFSTTVPGVTRGNHFHTRKIERFAVIKGKALIQLRKIGTDEVMDFHLDGQEPAYVDMPVWYTHNVKNVGDEELYTLFWIDEPYDPDNPDTYPETV